MDPDFPQRCLCSVNEIRVSHVHYSHMARFTVCLFVSFFVRLRISPPRIKLAASNFARRFIGVQGRESLIFVNFAPSEAQNRTNRPARGPATRGPRGRGPSAPSLTYLFLTRVIFDPKLVVFELYFIFQF